MKTIIVIILVIIGLSSCEKIFPHRTTTHLNLRKCPSSKSNCEVIKVLPPRTKVLIIKSNNQWYKVNVPEYNINGWVYSKYISRAFINLEGHDYNDDKVKNLLRIVNPWEDNLKNLKFLFFPIDAYIFKNILALFGIVFSIAFYIGLSVFLSDTINFPRANVLLIIMLALLFSFLLVGAKMFIIGYIATMIAFAFIGTLGGGIAFGIALKENNYIGIFSGILALVLLIVSAFSKFYIFELQIVFSVFLIINMLVSIGGVNSFFIDELPDIFKYIYNPTSILLLMTGALIFSSALMPSMIYFQLFIIVLSILGGIKGLTYD